MLTIVQPLIAPHTGCLNCGDTIMTTNDLKNIKYREHTNAVETHTALLEKLHLDTDIRLDEINNSLERITITLEEYLKVLGLP